MCTHNNKKNLTSHLGCFGMQDQSGARPNDRRQDNDPEGLGFERDGNESAQGENLPTNMNNSRKNQGSNGKSRVETG